MMATKGLEVGSAVFALATRDFHLRGAAVAPGQRAQCRCVSTAIDLARSRPRPPHRYLYYCQAWPRWAFGTTL